MKIITTQQIRELDQFTIKNEPIPSIDLMERAALYCANWIIERYTTETIINVICGLGNNGGDGLAIARLLNEKGFTVEVYIILYSDNRSEDFSKNFQRIKLISNNKLSISEIKSAETLKENLKKNTNSIVIDAIIGSGITSAAKGLVKECIDSINKLELLVISIDIPSGLFGDTLNEGNDGIVKAKYTLSFQTPKLSFMFIENAKYIGEFSILDIQLNGLFLEHLYTSNYFITKQVAQKTLKTRSSIAHKGIFGHALLVAGSEGKMGAAVLAGKACMRAGAGLLTVHIPKCGVNILQTTVPEAMLSIDTEEKQTSDISLNKHYNSIAVGPGIGTNEITEQAIKLLIQNSNTEIVFDADAINIISKNKTWLAFVPEYSIFTPHLKEFERLTGQTAKNSMERLALQKEFSVKNKVFIVLKGAHTSISCPNGDIYFNSTGNSGMATAGSGDTLTGIIVGLLAQGYSSMESCILGVYMHGLAGDFAAYHKTEEAMIASDISNYLPEAYSFIKSN